MLESYKRLPKLKHIVGHTIACVVLTSAWSTSSLYEPDKLSPLENMISDDVNLQTNKL